MGRTARWHKELSKKYGGAVDMDKQDVTITKQVACDIFQRLNRPWTMARLYFTIKGEIMNLNQFIGRDQLSVMNSACRGEEGEYFKAMIENLKNKISAMPKTYETEDQGDETIATLHYFNGGSDWYITERDAGSPDDEIEGVQAQAFGFACLNGDFENAEMGYISIKELIENGVELDLHYTPETIGKIKARFEKAA